MNKKTVYQNLENIMLKYTDLVDVPVQPVAEKLVPIKSTPSLVTKPIDNDMYAFTGDDIYVRKDVANRLGKASKLLKVENPELQLEVVYGYRALSIQKKLFQKYRYKLSNIYTGKELLEAVHRLIAVPEIAGHPTGGAVDVQILQSGKPIYMGVKIWEFNKDSFTFSPFVNKDAFKNRQLLRRVMMKSGFAPFDGEWWHFSFGDKEWAKYLSKPYAIYKQIDFESSHR